MHLGWVAEQYHGGGIKAGHEVLFIFSSLASGLQSQCCCGWLIGAGSQHCHKKRHLNLNSCGMEAKAGAMLPFSTRGMSIVAAMALLAECKRQAKAAVYWTGSMSVLRASRLRWRCQEHPGSSGTCPRVGLRCMSVDQMALASWISGRQKRENGLNMSQRSLHEQTSGTGRGRS